MNEGNVLYGGSACSVAVTTNILVSKYPLIPLLGLCRSATESPILLGTSAMRSQDPALTFDRMRALKLTIIEWLVSIPLRTLVATF